MFLLLIFIVFINTALYSMKPPLIGKLTHEDPTHLIASHYHTPSINLKDIFPVIPLLIAHANSNPQALQTLIYYATYNKFLDDADAYQTPSDPFKNMRWDQIDFSFFEQRSPVSPSDYLFWGIYYLIKKITDIESINEQLGIAYLEKAKSDHRALYLLGKLYEYKNDEFKAQSCYNKAQMMGSIPATFSLGLCYLYGFGQIKNIKQALELMKQAAKSDFATAAFYLGLLYETENNFVKQNYNHATFYYEKATQLGCLYAQNSLGVLYLQGNGVPFDIKKGIKLIHNAACIGFAPAQCLMGRYYCTNRYLPQNKEKAKKFFQEAVAQQHMPAYREYGTHLLKGTYLDQDISLGLFYLEIAAGQKDSDAQYELAIHHLNQPGAFNQKVGYKLLKQAHRNHHQTASYLIARLYIEHKPAKQTIGIALMNKLAAQGFPHAQHYVLYGPQARPVSPPEQSASG